MRRLIPYRTVLHIVNPMNEAEVKDCGICAGRLADSVGGTGSHGRKRRTAGHVKAVLSKAQVTVQVCVRFAVCARNHKTLHDYS